MQRNARQVRYAVRTLWKSPAFTASAVLLVGLGVGSVTTIFSLIDRLVLRPLPYPSPERLVSPEEGSHSGPLFKEMQSLPGFELWAAGRSSEVNLTSEGDPQSLRGAAVTEDFFTLFGARATRGRLFNESDFESRDGVVVSEGSWRRVWGGDPDLVGRSIIVDGQPVTVLGILSASFTAPEPIVGRSVDLWQPVNWSDPDMGSHDFWVLEAVGRLQPGVDIATAQTAMNTLMERMAGINETYRVRDGEAGRRLPVVPLSQRTSGGFRAGLGLLFGAVGILLLVACANVAQLFLARGLGRQREMAIRRALGADTRTLVGQLMVESLVVGAAGSVVGLLFATLGLRGFLALSPYALPRDVPMTLDWRVMAFATLLAGFTALAFGLLPALRSVGGNPGAQLKSGTGTATSGRRANVVRNGLLVGEVGLSLVLIASAGLLLRSFFQVQAQDPGFNVQSVWTIPVRPSGADTPALYVLAMEEVRRSLEQHPEVASSAYGLTMPLEMTGGSRCCWRTSLGTEDESVALSPQMHPVSQQYFSTLGIPVLYGRSWSVSETSVDPVHVVVSESFANEAFGGAQEALQQIVESGSTTFLVIGVVGEVGHYGLDAVHGPAVYLPIERVPFSAPWAHMAVRLRGAASAGIGRSLREAVWNAAPNLPVPLVRPMDEWLKQGSAERRFDAVLFGTFGVVALLLAAGGLYGTLLYVTGQRRRELAIRLALGATRGAVERRVLRGGLALAALGIAVGLVGSWIATRFLESRLYGVERGDPWALLGASALLLVTALLASWLPARRAGRTDPLEMLKAE